MSEADIRLVDLLAADDELVLLDRDFQVGLGKSRYRQDYAQAVLAALLDIVGWIAVIRGLGDPVHQPLEMIEAE